MSTPKKLLLFCYGSNSPEQLGERLGRPIFGEAAMLRDYWRVFRGMSRRWGGGVASIARQLDRTTFGYVTQVTPDELDLLDRYEGVATGNYKRKRVKVEVEGRLVAAVCYVSTSSEYNEPTRAYLEAVARTVSAFWSGKNGPVTWRDFPLR